MDAENKSGKWGKAPNGGKRWKRLHPAMGGRENPA
jgi:hypothetical protein